MNVVLIVPTGIGAEIGGHAGDANPVAKLIGATCDNLITHPNVVNGSDINEMPPNTLYVDGYMLDKFLEGAFCLRRANQNRVLVAVSKPVSNEVVNAVSAARATIGLEAQIVELETPLIMRGRIEGNCATGDVEGWQELVSQISQHEFDALAISSPIEVDQETTLHYLNNGGINPWGGVEAKASRLISEALGKPVAHSPAPDFMQGDFNEIVDPRMAAEMVSITYLHCILKGLHRAPRRSNYGLHADEVDFLVAPAHCNGPPHKACMERNIPIIAVWENKTCLNDEPPFGCIFVENYLEAAGLIMAAKAGVSKDSVTRPLLKTRIS